MMRVWLKCLCVCSLILALEATNGVYRVSRQDFPANKNPSPAAYQQPFEKNNGVYRVQRQDFANGNDVPFSDSYSNSYGNRFSKLNYGSGDVNPSYTPLPKLFLPVGVPRTDNPYLAIGIPNYDRIMPASDFAKEIKARTSAPTRINLRPKTTIYDEKQYDDGALPALPNFPSYDSALPSISEYSKSSSFGEDFSSAVEQFNMTEDRKNICAGANCRRSNENDDADAVRPIRRTRSIDHDPYNSFGGYRDYDYEPQTRFNPRDYRTPVSDHEYDRVYAHLVAENGEISNEQTEAPSSLSDPLPSWIDQTISESEPLPSINDLEVPRFDPSLSLNFDALVAHFDNQHGQETTTSDDFSPDYSAFTTETSQPTADPSIDDGMNYTPIECDFLPQPTDPSAAPAENVPDSESNSEMTTNSYDISTDPLLSVDFESLIARAHHQHDQEPNNSDDFTFDEAVSTTESPTTPADSNLDDDMNNTPIECDFLPQPTDPSATPSESVPDSESNSEMTTNSYDISTDPLLSVDFESLVARAHHQHNQEPNNSNDFTFDEAVSTTESPMTPADSNLDDDMNNTPIECDLMSDPESNSDTAAEPSTTEYDSEYNSDTTTNSNDMSNDPVNNSETSPTQEPEQQTEEDIQTTDKKLIMEYKFRVTFVCMMWPDVYQKSKFDLYDSRDIKMYHLCKFFNALNTAHPSGTSDSKSDHQHESETSTNEESVSSELLSNYLAELFQGNEQTAGLSFDNGADSSSNAESGLANESETHNGNIEPLITRDDQYHNFLNQLLGENRKANRNDYLYYSRNDGSETDSASFSSPMPTVMDIDDV